MMMHIQSKSEESNRKQEEEQLEVEQENEDYQIENLNLSSEISKYPLTKRGENLQRCALSQNIYGLIENKYKVKSISSYTHGFKLSVVDVYLNQSYDLLYSNLHSFISPEKILLNLKLLQFFNHDSISRVYDMNLPLFPHKLSESYILVDRMNTNLKTILQSAQLLTDDHAMYFMYLILRTLLYIHSSKVICRNLNPSNLGMNPDQIIFYNFLEAANQDYSEREDISSIFGIAYKAPEQIIEGYSTYQSDIWAAGCIFAELILKKELFNSNFNLKQYITQIIQFYGSFSKEDYSFIKNPVALEQLKDIQQLPLQTLEQRFPNANPIGLDLLSKMLQFNPEKRPDALSCLKHKYLEEIYDPEYDIPSDKEFDWKSFQDLKAHKLIKEQLYRESLFFKNK